MNSYRWSRDIAPFVPNLCGSWRGVVSVTPHLLYPGKETTVPREKGDTCDFFLMFEFPCIISVYYIKNQQDATLAVLFISNCKITLHVSDAFCVHHQEY